MIKKIAVVSLFVFLFFQVKNNICYADNAEALPKGVSRVRLNGQIYFPVDEKYDPDGNKEDVAADYNTTFDSSVFADLALVETAFGMPSGSANIGDSVVSFDIEWRELDFFYEYGVTDRLTVGVHIPYWWNKTNVDEARLDTSNATVGKSAIGVGFGAPLAPLAGPFPDTVPLTTEDTQDLLGNGLDVDGDGVIDIPGFGYKRFGTWSDSGLSDIEFGARYQYLKTEDWRLAFTGAFRFPIGEVDDPDNLVDTEFGEGVYALLFQFQNDYIATENFVLNGTFRYELKLPDEETLRVPDDVNRPITANKEKVDRNLGDVINLEVSGTYQFLEGFSLSLLYLFEYGFKDDVSGDKGFAYKSLEDETDLRSHIGIIGLAYSTIPLYQKKKFPLPLDTFVKYRTRFAGMNRAYSQWISVGLAVYF
ncbi:MAG TPA: hypothetical protein ENI07_16595 [Desulfobacterales bacterium]|nr:hypothetical protein [Desulfobacterales bacterium]